MGINNPNFIQGPNNFNVGVLTVTDSIETQSLKVNDSTFVNGSDSTFTFGIATDPDRLQIECRNSDGSIQGIINLPFTP